MQRPVLILAAAVVGSVYGWASGVFNRNPYREPDGETLPAVPVDVPPNVPAWSWEPSPIWLPSYLLCHTPPNGFGITRTRQGYVFKSNADRARYTAASAVIGAAMGMVVGAGIHGIRVVRRRRSLAAAKAAPVAVQPPALAPAPASPVAPSPAPLPAPPPESADASGSAKPDSP